MDRFEVDVDPAGGGRSRQPFGGGPQARHAARDRQPQGVGAGDAPAGHGCSTGRSRRLTLTDAGRSYVAACKRILEDVGEAERAASGEYSAPRGDLIITAPIVFGRLHVLPVVIEFLNAYPDIDVRIVLADRVVNLLEEHVDLAVRIGELPDSSLVATRVGSIRRVVCASPATSPREARRRAPANSARMTASRSMG